MTSATPDTGRAYGGWRRERFGWFLGLNSWQLVLVTAAALPVLVAVGRSRWAVAGETLPFSVLGAALVVLPVRGRPAVRWLTDVVLYSWGRAMGWSRWRSAASTGAATPRELARP